MPSHFSSHAQPSPVGLCAPSVALIGRSPSGASSRPASSGGSMRWIIQSSPASGRARSDRVHRFAVQGHLHLARLELVTLVRARIPDASSTRRRTARPGSRPRSPGTRADGPRCGPRDGCGADRAGMPFGTAHDARTPSRSSRRSQCSARARCSWTTNRGAAPGRGGDHAGRFGGRREVPLCRILREWVVGGARSGAPGRHDETLPVPRWPGSGRRLGTGPARSVVGAGLSVAGSAPPDAESAAAG